MQTHLHAHSKVEPLAVTETSRILKLECVESRLGDGNEAYVSVGMKCKSETCL